jgi:CHAT domain-containing protein
MAICSYFNQDFAKAEVRVVDLLNGDLQPYPTFEARVQWLQGMLQLSRSDPVQSLRAYLRSLDLFERTGESGNVAVLNSLIAENLLHLGQKETAWNFRMQALLILRQKGSTRSQTILDEAAEAALYEGQYKVARYFQDEVVASVIKKGEPHPVAEAYLRRIPIQVRLGAREQAEADFQATLASARRIPDPPLRDRLEADALVAVNGARDAEVALAGLNRAVTLYERSDYHFRLVEVRRLRAKIFESLGRMSEAEADLYQALHEVEEEVQKVQDDFRESYLHDADPLFDDMIRFMAQPGRSGVTSLWYAERERLLSLPRANATRFPVITEWEPWLTSAQRFLPEDTVLFEFSVLDKEILVWVLDRREVRSFVVEMSKDKLDALINRLNVSLTSPKGFRRVSSALFNYLVRSGLTRPYRKIVFVPDKRLWEVPFSALYDEQTNRYLIEESLVAVAPSATLIMSEDRKLEEVKVPSILAFGDPAFDPRLALMLPRLKGAKFEALAAAALYPESSHSVFLGEAATVEAFVRYAPLKEVVHFSGHAVVADTSPFLLFAPSMSHPAGTLGVQEISQLDLRKTHIVILAGCRTARVPRAEGLASLSAAFLAAGVSEVIGSLWKVDDSITEQFFVEFHRHVAKGRSGEEALRRTQLLMLNRDVPESLPASWAGFQIMRRAYVPS